MRFQFKRVAPSRGGEKVGLDLQFDVPLASEAIDLRLIDEVEAARGWLEDRSEVALPKVYRPKAGSVLADVELQVTAVTTHPAGDAANFQFAGAEERGWIALAMRRERLHLPE